MVSAIISNIGFNSPYVVLGAAAGSRIIISTLPTALNLIDQSMNIYQALVKPRQHDQLILDRVTVEWDYDRGKWSLGKVEGAMALRCRLVVALARASG